MFDTYFFGALQVIVDTYTGAIVAVQDRITGEAAELHFLPSYIARAKAYAEMHWSACNDVCV